MSRAGTPPPRHLLDERDGLVIPDRGRGITTVGGADRPRDFVHLFERVGDRLGRSAEQSATVLAAGHALAPPSVRQSRVHSRGPSPADACPHPIPAFTGDVPRALHMIART